MMKSRILVAAVVAMTVFMAGCSDDLSIEEIQQKLVEANSNIKSYEMQMQMDMTMDVEEEGKSESVAADMSYTGAVDVEAKKMMMIGVMKMMIDGQEMSVDTEMYMDGAYIYMKTMGQWMKMQFNEQVWDQQNQVEQMVEIVETGDLKRLPDESINGKSHYVVEVTPDMETLLELVSQNNQQMEMFPEGFDVTKFIDSYKVKYYVEKSSFIIMRQEIDMVMSFNSLDLVGQMGTEIPEGEEVPDMNVVETIHAVVDLEDVDEPVEITVPAEAMSAQSMPVNMFGAAASTY